MSSDWSEDSANDFDSIDDSDDELVDTIVSPDEMLEAGLKVLHYTPERIQRACRETNVTRFKSHFGPTPNVACLIWEDLQRETGTELEGDNDNGNRDEKMIKKRFLTVTNFLMGLHMLRKYPTEIEREPIFDISPREGRDITWNIVKWIRNLKGKKIVWPDFQEDDCWVISVDGIHCWVQEPSHQIWSQYREHYSHKYNKAGWAYELGISISDSKLVWMNGPFKAGRNDIEIFMDEGLNDKLLSVKKSDWRFWISRPPGYRIKPKLA